MAHRPWHREGLLTGGPMGLGPQAQLAWRDQLNTNVPDLDTIIQQQAMANIAANKPESPSDVSALAGLEGEGSSVGNIAGAGLTGAGQYVSGLFETPEWNPMRKRENLGFPSFRRGTWSRSV